MARPLRRLILISLGALAGLLLFAVLAVVAFVWFVDADTFRPRIEQIASNQLGREVRLGRLHWNLGWRMGVASEGGSVANAPGFGDAPLASWRRISFGLALRPLLDREVLVDNIRIEGLTLDLQRDAAGGDNWTFAFPEAAEDDGARDTRIAIEGIRIEDSSVSFRDAAADAYLRLGELNLRLDPEPGAQLIPQAVNDVDLSARLHGGPLPGGGVPIALAAPRVAFDAGTPSLSLPEFRMRFDEARLEGTLDMPDPQAATARFTLTLPSLRAQLATLGIEPPVMNDPQTLGALRVETGLLYTAGSIALSPLSLTLDDTTFEGDLRIEQLSPMVLRFTLAGDEADIDRYLEPPEVQGEPFELPVAQLESLDVKGELRLREARMAGSTARDVVITVE